MLDSYFGRNYGRPVKKDRLHNSPPNVSSQHRMTRHLESATSVLLLVILVLCGCSKNLPLPVQLAQQIAIADRVILTNYPSSSLAFSGSDAQRILRAVSESKGLKMSKGEAPSCPVGFYFQFYRGTNLLLQLEGHDNHFHTSEGQFYQDDSGALLAAWQEVHK